MVGAFLVFGDICFNLYSLSLSFSVPLSPSRALTRCVCVQLNLTWVLPLCLQSRAMYVNFISFHFICVSFLIYPSLSLYRSLDRCWYFVSFHQAHKCIFFSMRMERTLALRAHSSILVCQTVLDECAPKKTQTKQRNTKQGNTEKRHISDKNWFTSHI